MPRPSNTLERRAQIVRGLMTVMARQGYERASVTSIARAANLAPGLVHYHFSTKREILVALVDSLAAALRARYARRLGRGRFGARGRLHAFIDAHLALGPDADPCALACWVHLAGEAVQKPEVGEVYRKALGEEMATLVPLVRETLSTEGRSARRSGAIAAGLFAAIEGAYQLGLAAPRLMPRGSASGTVKRMADGLVAAEPRLPEART